MKNNNYGSDYLPRSSDGIRHVFYEVVKQRRWKAIGKYVNSKTKIEMECENGHRWFPTANTVVNKKSNCPYCVGKKRWPGDIEKEVKRRGGEYMGRESIDGIMSYMCVCDKGHAFFVNCTLFWRGKWCPECKKKGLLKTKSDEGWNEISDNDSA